MTAITKLLAQKEQLTEQLQKVSAPEEREQIEGLLAINTALHLLVDAGPGLTD